MMSNRRTGVFSAALLAGLLSPAAPGTATELKVATFLPPTHPIVGLYEQLGKDLASEPRAT